MLSEKKKQKRENIAKSCFEIFAKNGFHNISVSQIAKTAGIGKGTVYEYFSNKEDIVLELMECMQREYDPTLSTIINNQDITPKELLYSLYDIFIDNQNQHSEKREVLKQFFLATIANPSDAIIEYNKTLKNKYTTVINEKINNLEKSNTIYDEILGQYLLSLTLNINLNTRISNIIDTHLKEI
jgi:AcrR family transcriptional regulator